METKVFNCSVRKDGRIPELIFEVGIPIVYGKELLLSISGFLAIESFGKVIDLNEVGTFRHSKGDYILYTERNNISFQENYWKLIFSASITHEVLSFIEDCRMKNSSKDVNFYLKFIARKLLIEHSHNSASNFQYIETVECVGDFKIPQSKWIDDYSNRLSVGKYLLVEFKSRLNALKKG